MSMDTDNYDIIALGLIAGPLLMLVVEANSMWTLPSRMFRLQLKTQFCAPTRVVLERTC